MKKNFLVYVLIIAFIFAVTACSNTGQIKTDDSKVEETISTTDSNESQTDSKENQYSAQGEEQKDEEGVQEEEQKSTQENVSSNKTVDLSLTGQALINSLETYARPDKIYMETVSTFADGTTATTKSYYYKNNFRSENEGDTGLQIMIYNSELGETYSYNDSTKTGILMSDDEDYEEGYSEDTDMSFDDEEYTDEDVELLTAEVQDLNGEKVIYSVVKTGSEGYNYEVHTYYSVKYGVPIKGETLLNGQLMNSYEVTEITDDINIDKSIFDKPEDVTFMDFDSLGGY